MSDNHEVLGPIDYLIVEFPDGRIGPDGFGDVVKLTDAGVIRVIDLEFFRKDQSGAVIPVDASTLSADGIDLAAFAGADAHLVAETDADVIDSLVQQGSVAAVLVYEVLPILHTINAWQNEGARVVAGGSIPADDFVAALDDLEKNETVGGTR